MMRDRNIGPDLAVPYRPLYHVPARLGSFTGQPWYKPFGIGMYWRAKYTHGSTSTSYPDWDDSDNVFAGPLVAIGGAASNGRTLTAYFELAGRVIPHEWVYTVRKTNNATSPATVTDTISSLVIIGSGEYIYSITAPSNGTAVILGSGSTEQINFPDA